MGIANQAGPKEGRAESVDLIFNDILLALHSFVPNQMRQIELEQQIMLC